MTSLPFYTPDEESKLVQITGDVVSHLSPHFPSNRFRQTLGDLRSELVPRHQLHFEITPEDMSPSDGIEIDSSTIAKECADDLDKLNGLPNSPESQRLPAIAFRIAELLLIGEKNGLPYSPARTPRSATFETCPPLSGLDRFMSERGVRTEYFAFEPGYTFSNGQQYGFVERRSGRDVVHLLLTPLQGDAFSRPQTIASYSRDGHIKFSDYITQREDTLTEFKKRLGSSQPSVQ